MKGLNMKKLIIVLSITLYIPLLSFAKDYSKEYEKMIKKYDIPSSAMAAPNLTTFWTTVKDMNESYILFSKALEKNTSAIKAASKQMAEGMAKAKEAYREFPYMHADSLVMKLLEDLGALSLNSRYKIYVVDAPDDFNAFTDPEGRMFLESGLILDEEMTYEILLGICAHEFAHYLLQHSYVEKYYECKRAKRNRIIAGVSAGLEFASAMYAASAGVVADKNIDKNIEESFVEAEFYAIKAGYKYSRSQEIEADIIAYRFLEYIGVGGETFIKALELLNTVAPDYNVKGDTHPTQKYRIELLKYMQAHPELNK